MKNLIIIPTYNEANNCSLIYSKIREVNSDIEILFIDDNSPDNTSEEIKNLSKKDQKVFLFERISKLGVGSAHKVGFEWSKNKNYQNIITIDADLSHNPELITKMLELTKDFDIIITSRFLLKDTLVEWPVWRQLVTKIRHSIRKNLFKIPYDTSGAFRCYNLKKINLDDMTLAKNNGYSFFWESLIILFRKGYSIKELPMKQPTRIHGSSKIRLMDILDAIFYLVIFYFKTLFTKISSK